MRTANNTKITIAGDLGSGKSAVGKLLAHQLAYAYLSTGLVQRDIAARRGMSTLELNKYAESHPEIDEEIDSVFKELRDDPRNYVVDSRMAWHFVTSSFRVFLTVDPRIAVSRVRSDRTRQNEEYSDFEEAFSELRARKESENRRFLAKYGVDCSNEINFDMIVDTSHVAPDKAAFKIQECFSAWHEGHAFIKYWLSPKRVYPTQSIRETHIMVDAASSAKVDDPMFSPVNVVQYKGHYFIVDGHKQVARMLNQESALVPCVLLARDQEEVFPGCTAESMVETPLKLSWIYDWEDAFGFSYSEYPPAVQD